MRGSVVPLSLLGLLLAGLLVYVPTQAAVHGDTYDEPLQNDYGHRMLRWYLTGGSDTSFLDFPTHKQMPQHGPFYETVVAAVQALTGSWFGADQWVVRAQVTGFTGVLGIALMALCGLELGRSVFRGCADRAAGSACAAGSAGSAPAWLALVSALALTLYPRYTGAIFNNSKDLPLAVAMLLVLWLALRLVRRWPARSRRTWLDAALLGIALGAALSIRVNAVLWYPLLGLVALAWLVRSVRAATDRAAWVAELRRLVLVGVLVGVSSYLTTLALWPYILLNPLRGLPDAYASMSRYPWNHGVLFQGAFTRASQLPRSYAPVWLWIGSPAALAVLAVVGIVLALAGVVRRRAGAGELVVLAAGLVPLLAIVALRPTLYNAGRHFLFLVPPLVLVAALTLVRLVRYAAARRRALGGVVVALAVLSQVPVVVGVARLYPYEYMYFNEAAGGFSGLHQRYDTDYWGECTREATLWLDRNWRSHTPKAHPVVENVRGPESVLAIYLDPPLRPARPGQRPDFAIVPARPGALRLLPRYQGIHPVYVDGARLCRVKDERPGR